MVKWVYFSVLLIPNLKTIYLVREKHNYVR